MSGDLRRKAPAPMTGAQWTSIACAALGLAYALVLVRSLALGLWIIDRSGAPVRADFSVYWASARLVCLGHANSAYDWPSVRATLQQVSGAPFPSGAFPFFYPPLFLAVLAPLGMFGYAPAAVLWITATCAGYLRAAFVVLRVRGVLLAVAAPAALWCICVGQNGLLTASLLAFALSTLERRPIIAGIFFALLSFKPQLCVLVPLVLIASGRWRAFASAATGCAVLWFASGVVLGFDTYASFWHATRNAEHIFLIAGGLPWFKMQSVYGLLRTLHAGESVAALFQLLVSIGVAGSVIALWRSRARFGLKGAALAAGTLAVSPYVQIYDFPIATVAVLFLLRDSENDALTLWQALALAIAFLAPLAFSHIAVPLGPVIDLLLGAVIATRALGAPRSNPNAPHRENLAPA